MRTFLRMTKYLTIIAVLFVSVVMFGRVDSYAATDTGVFYWWSSSSSGYSDNSGTWHSWDEGTPALCEKRYDMNSNVIDMDGYKPQKAEWGGSSAFLANDGYWKKKVIVTYYKADPTPTSTPLKATDEIPKTSGIPLNSPIQVIFNNNIQPGPNVKSITANGSTQSVSGIYISQNTCTFYINGETYNTTYNINVPYGAFMDASDTNNLNEAVSFSFTTVQGQTQNVLQSISVSPSVVNLSNAYPSQYLTVQAHYSDGTTTYPNTIDISFTSSNPSVAYVSNGTVMSRGTAGTATITVIYKGVSAYITVNVADSTPLYVQTANPGNISGVALNAQVQLYFNKNIVQGSNTITVTANGYTQSTSTLNISQNLCSFYINGETNNTTYIVNIPSGAFRDASTGINNTPYTFSFTTVQAPRVLQSISVSPSTVNISSSNSSQYLTVQANYSDGTTTYPNTIDINFTSSNPSIAYVSNGTVTSGGTAGTATITANYLGVVAYITVNVGDTTPLTVQTTTPANSATGVVLNTPVQVYFNKNIIQGPNAGIITVNGGTQNVSGLSVNQNTCSFSISGETNNTTYTVNVPAGAFKDTAGNLNTAYTFSFTTVPAPQKVLQSISVTPSTVNISGTNTSGQAITVQAQYSDGTTSQVTSSVTFTSSNSSIATVTNGTVVSGGTSGTAVITAAYQGVYAYITVTVADTTPLTVQTTTPANSATGVVLNTPVQVYFNKNIIQGPNAGIITVNGGTQNVSGLSVNQSTCSFSISGEANNTAYTVNIPSGAFKDTSGNLSTAYTFSFTTVQAQKVLQSISVTPSTLNISGTNTSQAITVQAQYSDGTNGIINTSSVNFTSSNSSVATVTNGTIVSGGTAGIAVITAAYQGMLAYITVSAADTTQPTVRTTIPANSTTGAAVNSQVQVTFSENIITGPNIGGILINNGLQSISGLIVNQNSCVFYISGETGGMTYTINIPAGAFEDAAGNLSTAYTFSFTTAVQQKVLQSISIIPSSVNITGANTTGQYLTVQAQYSDGTTGVITSGVTFTSSNTSVATVTNGTVISGGTSGTAVITAYYQNMQAFCTVTVTSTTQLTVQTTIPANNATAVAVNSQVQLYFNENVTTGSNIGGILVNNGLQTISSITTNQNTCSFNINGEAANTTYTVYIPAGAFKDTAGNLNTAYTFSFTTTQAQKTIQSISIIPSSVNILPSYTTGQYLIVQAQYSDGTSTVITSGVTFTSSNSSVAYVTGNTVYGSSVGTAVITAYYQGVQAYSTITVSNNTQSTVNTPVASVPSGVVSQPFSVILTADSGTVIRYTTDNSEPTSYSTIYTTPISVSSTTTIKAKAFLGSTASPTMTAVYVFSQSTSNIGDMLSRARALYNAGKYDDAIALLNQLLGLSPDNQDAVILLADCYIKKSDSNTAKSRLLQFINVYEYPRVVNKYAEVCIDRGEYDEARQKIVNILPKYENEIYLYSTLVRSYEHLGITGIRVFTHGTEIDFSKYDNVYPTLNNGRTIIPLRALAESLGATVNWVNDSTAIIQLGDKKIEVTKDSRIAQINGQNYVMDIPATIVNTRLMVPLRFVSENFGYQVNWYSIESTVNIISITNNE